MSETVEFFFSFRSPYCWLAFRRLFVEAARYQFHLVHLPVFPPTPSAIGGNDAPGFETPEKLSYIWEDISRLTRARHLEFRVPSIMNCNWNPIHSAFCLATRLGKGKEFGEAGFAARFSNDVDLSRPSNIARIAESVGLEGPTAMGASEDEGVKSLLRTAFRRFREVGGFGVPLMVYRGERFWGQDRIDALIERQEGIADSCAGTAENR